MLQMQNNRITITNIAEKKRKKSHKKIGELIKVDYPQPLNVLQENVTDPLIISFNMCVGSTLPEKKTRKKSVPAVTYSHHYVSEKSYSSSSSSNFTE